MLPQTLFDRQVGPVCAGSAPPQELTKHGDRDDDQGNQIQVVRNQKRRLCFRRSAYPSAPSAASFASEGLSRSRSRSSTNRPGAGAGICPIDSAFSSASSAIMRIRDLCCTIASDPEAPDTTDRLCRSGCAQALPMFCSKRRPVAATNCILNSVHHVSDGGHRTGLLVFRLCSAIVDELARKAQSNAKREQPNRCPLAAIASLDPLRPRRNARILAEKQNLRL